MITRRHTFGIAACAAVLGACDGGKAAQPPLPDAVGQGLSDPIGRSFYERRGWRPAWNAAQARSLAQATLGARAHGLRPHAFAPKLAASASAAETDENLTIAALAYAKALSSGFIDPGAIESIFTLARNAIDLAAGLAQALDRGDVGAWLGSLAPGDAEYKAISDAYLATHGLGEAPPAAGGAAPAVPSEEEDRHRRLAGNLERRRWLSRSPSEHRIDVNTAGAFLTYLRPGTPVSTARVVVGRDDHRTPCIEAAFHRLIANPPWIVPMDIARREILRKGRRYLARERMRWVNGRIEQAPGPRSSLGLVKFDVEDRYEIYLHDTPSKALFAQPERHRSHGCVRVENAVAFARSIAAETDKADAFDQALASKRTTEVELGQSIPVRMLYHTAWVDEGGQVRLAPDVYGADAKLTAALGLGQTAAARRREPQILFGP